MDPDNPVVQLCALGMEAESVGQDGDALALFLEAWDTKTDDFEGSIAAHYVARHQATPSDTFRWNEEALRLADECEDDRIKGFYPSLYLNMSHACEEVGQGDRAGFFIRQAAERLADLDDGPYGDMVRRGVASALERLGIEPPESA